ncbi:MAG: histidine phosphatase family protein [Oscillospiraceae bacterium]|jgi:probable phosphoglycerate mutase|nr:histidine phosphatase family protein [Oscillospiraceae bacterium]
MSIYVVRHGETEHNRQGRFTGSIDAPLNESGRLQAATLARRMFETVRLDAIVSSPMLRALETARAAADAYHLPIETADEFVERNMGVYEGLTVEECRERYPDQFARKPTFKWDDAPEGGETLRQIDARVSRGLDRVLSAHPDKEVMIVCHGVVVMIIGMRLCGLSLDEMRGFRTENCGLYVFQPPFLNASSLRRVMP